MDFYDSAAEGSQYEAHGYPESTFSGHPRTSTLISAFSEGIVLSSSGMESNVGLQASNGFELMRQLTLEYSVKTRSEALSFRSANCNRTFTLSASETSPASVVTDTIRRLDYEAARFQKLLGTLPKNIDVTGLQLAEPDLLAIMLRSLPEAVRNFVLHHAGGDTYSRSGLLHSVGAAQRMFQEFHTKKGISKSLMEQNGMMLVVTLSITLMQFKEIVVVSVAAVSIQVSHVKWIWQRSNVSDARSLAMWASIVQRIVRMEKEKKGFSKGVQKGDRFDKGKSKGKSSKGSGSKGKSEKVLAKRENLMKFHGMKKIHGGMTMSGSA